ncbi:MAG: hypothetical protein RTU92_03615 [Candidatus Thorarchaeota archaeon]
MILNLRVMPKSALLVLDHVACEGPSAPREIAMCCEVPLRTVSFALKRLREHDLLVRVPNLEDMRTPMYRVNQERVKEMRQSLRDLRIRAGLHLRMF